MTLKQQLTHYTQVLQNLRKSTHPNKEKYIAKTTTQIAIIQKLITKQKL